MERIPTFDSELNYIKEFGYGELSTPVDIKVLSHIIYILSMRKELHLLLQHRLYSPEDDRTDQTGTADDIISVLHD